jgi:hypothetical protein
MRTGLVVVLLVACSKPEAPAADAAPVASAPEPPKKPPVSTVIAKGLAHPARALAMDGAALYWTTIGKQDAQGHHEAGMVMKMPKDGGNQETLASGLHNPDGLAVDGGRVYFTSRGTEKMYVLEDDGKVLSVAITGGEVKTLVDKKKQPTEIVVRNGDVFVIERGSWTPVKGSPFAHKNNPDGSVFKLAGGKGAPVMLASKLTSPHGLAVDGTNVYFVLDDKEGKGSAIMTAGPAKQLAKLETRLTYVTSDGTNTFAVAPGGEGAESKILKVSATPSPAASRPGNILAMYAVKNGPVLFTTQDGELVAVNGSAVKVVANGFGEPRSLVADEQFAYVGAGDKIHKVNLKSE